MSQYKPKPQLIERDFYAVEVTGWVPVNKMGQVLTPDGSTTRGTPPSDHWPYYTYDGSSVHRLIALTFQECPGDPKHYHVNHDDGDKTNNRNTNLFWTTPSQNAQHAYENGLRKDNRPILVRDLETFEEQRFYSLQACARHFEVNGAYIHHYLKSKRAKPWRKKWVLIYEGESWPNLTKDDITDSGKFGAKDVVSVDLETNIKVVYDSTATAARENGINDATLQWYLKRRGVKATNIHKGREWWYLSEYTEEIKEAKRVKGIVTGNQKVGNRKPKRVKVITIETGDVTVWNSLWVLAEAMGWKKNSLEKAIWRTKGVFKGNKYEYLENVGCPASLKGLVGTS